MPALLEQAPPLPGGWEAKGDGFVYAGDLPLWSANALREPEIRASLEPTYKSAFVRWLASAGQGGPMQAWDALDGGEKKALSEGTDAAGGFLVPGELAGQILTTVRERSIVRRSARVIPTVRDLL